MATPRLDSTCVLAGLTAAVASGLVWAGVAIGTGYEVGYLAVGVGAFVGWAVNHGTLERGMRVGLLAAGLALLGLVVGKYVTAQYGMTAGLVKWLEQNEDFFAQRLCVDELRGMVANDEAPADLQEWLDDPTREVSPSRTKKIQKWLVQAAVHFRQRPEAEQQAIYLEYAEEGLERASFQELLHLVASPHDILWALLALSAAFQAGARGGQAADTSGEVEEVPDPPTHSPPPGAPPARPSPTGDERDLPTRDRKVIKARRQLAQKKDSPGRF